ncbi:MAG: D-tyrosyl-tRNA(Tyr) deacylase [Candidatus Eisenbacteria bacterium]|uniref:D-aminoacyl-tRNA deacylase n=1 Tax=Eiseniibacteriota bacterium TaxID=2212470 RepID=A0A538TPF3_UNCEI|nr:MAG: D-tyrosyl-tRNA(Tyr) deacylase [Candidatus Eisenbacteria bacterium]
MKALVQRVSRARVAVHDRVVGEIARGLLVFVAATHTDDEAAADWLAAKAAGLRIFPDAAGKMARDVRDAQGAMLIVPQFTLYGDTRRGRRPEFIRAAPPEQAERLFDRFCRTVEASGIPVARGAFRESMRVELVNEGPVTLLLESPAPGET